MYIDLTIIPAVERKRLVEIGQDFSSKDTLAQADQTLNAFDNHKEALAASGFTQKKADALTELRGLLIAAGGDRDETKGTKKVSRKALRNIIKAAQQKRLQARAVLSNIHEEFAKLPTEEAMTAAQTIEAVLSETSSSVVDSKQLAAQCTRLSSALGEKTTALEASAQNLGGLALDLEACSGNLLAAEKASSTSRGAPVEQERLDLLDGLIVELVRNASKAARAASAASGNQAIAKEFELNKLYKYPAAPASTSPTKPQ